MGVPADYLRYYLPKTLQQRLYNRLISQGLMTMTIISEQTHKHCNKCDQGLPMEAFNNNRARKDGKQDYCRDCHYENFWNPHSKKVQEDPKLVLSIRMSTLIYQCKCRAKRDSLPFNLTNKRVRALFPDSMVCPATGEEMVVMSTDGSRARTVSIDRIIPEKGYVLDNIQFISQRANSMKRDKSPRRTHRVCSSTA